jgi:hypothetical protein
MGPFIIPFRIRRSGIARRMVLFLLSLWTWDRVLVDCAGAPEAVAYYYFQATLREGQWITCRDEKGKLTLCYQIVSRPPVRFGPNIPDPGIGATVTTSYDPVAQPEFLPLPPIGSFVAWPWPTPENPQPVVAVDFSGNSGSQICQ